MPKRNFKDLPRPQQRLNLLHRLNRARGEIKQYLRDLQFFNDLQRSRRAQTIPEDEEMIRLLAHVDQEIREVRDSS